MTDAARLRAREDETTMEKKYRMPDAVTLDAIAAEVLRARLKFP